MNVALYARVSSEEQARHGLSIDAQIAALRAFAKREGHNISGEYIDAGISGKKPPAKRPALSRFFADMESGLKVDLLLFTKLDRFFRSVKLYYQAMDVLEKNHVAWQAIQEDYETLTASGRMKVNIMLSVAENEADRTSERIKAAFEYKIAKGEVISASGLPFGYSYVDKKAVPNEDAPAALAAFEFYSVHGNKLQTRDFIHSEYGHSMTMTSLDRLLHNTLYKGEYRGNVNFCEPIVPAELFDKVQRDLESRSTRRTPSGRVYLFSGIIFCRECGRRMTSAFRPPRYPYYRCMNHAETKNCANPRTPHERTIETFLLTHVEEQLAGIVAEYTPEKKKKPPNRAAIQRKLERLKDLYIDELITKDQYKADYAKLTAQLSEPEPPKYEAVQKILGSDFRKTYTEMTRQERKDFWRTVLDHLEVDASGKISIFFAR